MTNLSYRDVISIMLKFSPDNNTPPRSGCVLLSEPFLDDPYFNRTVILLCEHNEEGSFGFVLNNYVDITIDRIVPEMPALDGRVALGGPVKNSNLFYLHALGDRLPNSLAVTDNIYMGGDFEQLKAMIDKGEINEGDVRFFIGYSGWSPRQLEGELEAKSWFVTDADEPLLMDSSIDDLWERLMGRLGKAYAHLANTPTNPNLN